MLTEEELLKVHALHQRRVADRRYLEDVEIKQLRIEAVMDLVTSALYANEQLRFIPFERDVINQNHRLLLREAVITHRRNIIKHQVDTPQLSP